MDLKNKQPYLMRSKYDLEKELVEVRVKMAEKMREIQR